MIELVNLPHVKLFEFLDERTWMILPIYMVWLLFNYYILSSLYWTFQQLAFLHCEISQCFGMKANVWSLHRQRFNYFLFQLRLSHWMRNFYRSTFDFRGYIISWYSFTINFWYYSSIQWSQSGAVRWIHHKEYKQYQRRLERI